MDLFDNLLQNEGIEIPKSLPSEINQDHAVIIYFKYGIDELDDIHALERRLEQVVEESHVGKLDGHEVAMDNSDAFLYLYGPNAETLFKAIKPILEESYLMKGAIANLRFGPPGEEVPEIDIEI